MAKFNIKTVKPKFTITTAPDNKIDVVVNKPILTAKNTKTYFKLKNTGGLRGEKGEKGDTGTAATIAAGTATSLPSGSTPTVTNTGTSSAAVFNFGIPKGDKGDKGDTGATGATGSPGEAATISVGTTSTGLPGTNASVTNTGTSSAAVLNFTIPRGEKGDKGDTGSTGSAATVEVGATSTGAAGTNASVTNTGTSSAAVLNFTIPRGDKGDKGDTGSAGAAATISVGTVTTGAEGSDATVTNSGTSSAAVFDFTIPRGATGATGGKGDKGDQGDAATISVGTTTTGAAGTNASVTNSGTTGAAVLDFTIPRGNKGDKGDKGDTGNPGDAATVTVGTVTTGAPGTSATVVNSGTSSAAVLDFTIPRGDKGESGSGAGDMLAADYDPNGTVQNAGGIVDYVDSQIPTVNNATLTIQQNGSNVQTFTANQGTNATANITVPTKTSDLLNDGADNTAAYLETDETAYRTTSIPYGECDASSTSTVFTATVPGITELRDGVCMWLKNGVVTSASGFTININGLGAKPVYSNMGAVSRETTLWNANYTMLFVYDSTRVYGGCWVLYRGYNSNDNTIGYQIRTNSQTMPTTSVMYRYRIFFTSADGAHYVPANNSTSTNATSSRTACQDPIDPFGAIFYYSGTAIVTKGSRPAATSMWQQYAISLGYSFNTTGAALSLTNYKPVYVVATPQTDGSAIIDSATPYVQDLPTTEDGKIYIFLGIAYSATNIELQVDHPVYWYKDGMIRPYTNASAGGISSVEWGDITGTLSDQTDLNTALEAKADTSSLAAVATSGLYSDLTGTPTIPTVNNATLTIQKNGTTVNSFTANASSNVTANITVPTATSDLTNDSGFITDAGVTSFNGSTGAVTYTAPVTSVNGNTGAVTVSVPTATSDLTNDSGFITSSDLPTVGNATLTIQKNGTNVQTFTANATSNKTANITVPTQTSELTNNSGFITAEDITSTAALTPPVSTDMIENGAVTTAKLGASSVTNAKLATAAVQTTNILDGAVTASKIDFTTMPFATAYTDSRTDNFSGRVPYSAFTQNNGFILSNNGLVCPKSGYYIISARLSGFGTGGWLRVHVSSSTSTTTVATIVASAIDRRATGVYHTVSVTPTIAYVAQGQYIYAYQTDAGVDLNSGMDAGIEATVLTAVYIGG
jgi:hypothetical protein